MLDVLWSHWTRYIVEECDRALEIPVIVPLQVEGWLLEFGLARSRLAWESLTLVPLTKIWVVLLMAGVSEDNPKGLLVLPCVVWLFGLILGL